MSVELVETTFELNGTAVTVRVPADRALLDVLRDECGITSTRGSCGLGVCGTCTVLLDGRAASACLLLAAQVDGRAVTTSEGLAHGRELSRVQQAFVDCGAYQCSYCIPAMTVMIESLLRTNLDAGVDEVRHHLQGNLCRCGTYPQVLRAVAEMVRPGDEPPDRAGSGSRRGQAGEEWQ